ncbi:hypothetical protein DFH28DRAFT_986421, partial [Melampsora americana]
KKKDDKSEDEKEKEKKEERPSENPSNVTSASEGPQKQLAATVLSTNDQPTNTTSNADKGNHNISSDESKDDQGKLSSSNLSNTKSIGSNQFKGIQLPPGSSEDPIAPKAPNTTKNDGPVEDNNVSLTGDIVPDIPPQAPNTTKNDGPVEDNDISLADDIVPNTPPQAPDTTISNTDAQGANENDKESKAASTFDPVAGATPPESDTSSNTIDPQFIETITPDESVVQFPGTLSQEGDALSKTETLQLIRDTSTDMKPDIRPEQSLIAEGGQNNSNEDEFSEEPSKVTDAGSNTETEPSSDEKIGEDQVNLGTNPLDQEASQPILEAVDQTITASPDKAVQSDWEEINNESTGSQDTQQSQVSKDEEELEQPSQESDSTSNTRPEQSAEDSSSNPTDTTTSNPEPQPPAEETTQEGQTNPTGHVFSDQTLPILGTSSDAKPEEVDEQKTEDNKTDSTDLPDFAKSDGSATSLPTSDSESSSEDPAPEIEDVNEANEANDSTAIPSGENSEASKDLVPTLVEIDLDKVDHNATHLFI